MIQFVLKSIRYPKRGALVSPDPEITQFPKILILARNVCIYSILYYILYAYNTVVNKKLLVLPPNAICSSFYAMNNCTPRMIVSKGQRLKII